MLYMFGTAGFILGFMFGQMLLLFFLNGVSRKDLLEDKRIRLKYGLLNWAIAILACYGAIVLYQRYYY